MHAKDGSRVEVGDCMIMHVVVKNVSTEEGYCNCTVETFEPMFPGPHKTTITINTKQLEGHVQQ